MYNRPILELNKIFIEYIRTYQIILMIHYNGTYNKILENIRT